MPGFELLPAPMRLWARLQAGMASTADLQALQKMLEATVRALQRPALQSTMAELFEVCSCIDGAVLSPEQSSIRMP
jgi:hypothetical protein